MKPNSFEYLSELQAICSSGTTCPPPTAKEASVQAFHWTKTPATAACFLPVGKRNPPRLHRAKDAEERCDCWGISMHMDLSSSIAAFHAVERSFPNARKTLGNSVACGQILPAHGVCTAPDKYKHFNLHPYTNANLCTAFGSSTAIPPL